MNDRPHIGHAYTSIACDVMARYQRLSGKEVMFLTGTDEHGQKVEKSAAKAAIPPQKFTDEVSQHFRDLTSAINLSNTDFIRTTQERHKKAAQDIWKRLLENGAIYLDKYAGWYSIRDEAFYTEEELVEGKAPTGADVEWVEEPSYFFKLSEWQDKLLAFYEENPDFILPQSRKNEVISFVKGGLKDLSVSRTTFNWGVPVPDDDVHVMYVWLDALTNYITAIDYPDTDSEHYQHYWPGIHVVGKDILRFHAVYWPAFLMAAGLETPKQIIAHGWWTNEGEKISKSLGNVIDPLELKETYGLDAMRYFLMREVPFGKDGNFSRDAMMHRMNGDLSNNIGNLVQRTLSMIFKNCDATIPSTAQKEAVDDALLNKAYNIKKALEAPMQKFAFHQALEEIFIVADAANRYVDEQAPWTLKKIDPARMEAVLYTLAETIRTLAIALQPFIPDSADKMLDTLHIANGKRELEHIAADYALEIGQKVEKPEIIFPRYQENNHAGG